ncbi:MAG: hypothetical protein KAT65_12965 [Methanophagales archaeon]|nr:hypothetical protein [Methanophagales archaeon]
MSATIGFLGALVAIILWGTYFVPMKKVKDFDPFYYQLLMCNSIFLSSLVLAIFLNVAAISIFGFISGILWTIGNVLSVFAVKYSGLAKSASIWMSSVIMTSFFWGVIYFKEALSSISYGLAGILLLIIGIASISSITSGSNESFDIKGTILAILAGIIFGSQLVPFKFSSASPIQYILPMGFGILVGGWAIYVFKRSRMDTKIIVPGSFSGIMWEIANVGSFFAVANMGLAIGQPLTQMALFVSVLWGVLYFKEIRGRSKVFKMGISALLLFLGAILLSFAR